MCTESEHQFLNYCDRRGYPVEKIKEKSNQGRTPDYKVITPAGEILAEVKELTPNNDDIKYYKSIKDATSEPRLLPLGTRVNKIIKNASGQLKVFKDCKIPCVIVAYENFVMDGKNVNVFFHYLSENHIEAGMFGRSEICFHLNSDKKTTSRYGGKRQITNSCRLYISAFIELANDICDNKDEAHLRIYHNPFAQYRLYPRYFPHSEDEHFIKSGDPTTGGIGWCEYIGKRT